MSLIGQLTNVVAMRGVNGIILRHLICKHNVQSCRTVSAWPMRANTELERHNSGENDYIYRHIHSGLKDRFATVADMAPKLPIYPAIQDLTNLSDDPKQLSETLPTLRGQIQTMNQIELTSLLSSIKDRDTFEYRVIKRMIDHEMRWLLKEHVKTRLMDLDLWFYIADIFYECKVKSKFTKVLIDYLAEEDITMTNRQMLHLLFLIVLQRNEDGILRKYEERITQLVNKVSFEDVAIICLAYFKTKTVIKNTELLRRIVDKTADNLSNIDPTQPGYCSIIKSIRYSRTMDCRENVNHLVMSLTQDLNRRIIFASPFNAVHTIKMMESFRVYDPQVIHLLRVSMFQNLNEFRIKDIQYALTSLSNFAYQDLQLDEYLKRDFDKLSDQIINETRDDFEYQHYHLVAIARAMAVFAYYNDKLIDYINQVLVKTDKYDIMKNSLEFNKSCLLLYTSTMIEGGSVKLHSDNMIFRDMAATVVRSGNFGSIKQDMSLDHLKFILKSSHSPSLTNSNQFRNIAQSLASSDELKAPEYNFNFQYTLPHQNYADLIITKNKPAPGRFSSFTLRPSMPSQEDRVCLLYALHKADFVDGHQRLSGYKRMMIRLLTKLNYNVIQVDLNKPDISSLSHRIKCILDQE